MPDPITPRHAAMILARAAAIDNRDPSAAADEVWADALTRANVDYRDCMAAVGEHYAASADRLMPFHVIAIARRFANARAEADANRQALAPPPDDILPTEVGAQRVLAMLAEHRARKRAQNAAAGPGVPVPPDDGPTAAHGPHSGPHGDSEWLAGPPNPGFRRAIPDDGPEDRP